MPAAQQMLDDQEAAGAADIEARAGVRDLLIINVVRSSDVSVRLANAIEQGHRDDRLPCNTVGDYLDAGHEAIGLFMRTVPNFGRKTGFALQELIEEIVARGGISSAEPSKTETSLDRILAEADVGHRLVNCIVRHLGPSVIQDCLDLHFAAQASEMPIFGHRAARVVQLDDPVFRDEELGAFLAVGRIVNFRAVIIDHEIVA